MPEMNLGMTQPSWAGGNPFLGTSNPYLQQNIDNTMGDMSKNYNMLQKPNTESAMVGSGSFGNSGLMQMQEKQMQDQYDSMGKQAGAMRMQDYGQQQNMYQWDQGYNRSLYNDSVDHNNQNLQNVMGLVQQQNQFNQQDIANGTNVQNTPLNYQQTFSNMASGIGNGFASNSTTTQMPGNPLVGGLGGWALGSQIGSAIK